MVKLHVPGDKSISHRALMLAPLANGVSQVGGLATGSDVRATLAAMQALGVVVELDSETGQVSIPGPVRLRSPAGLQIDCGNSGTSARLLLGLLAGHPLTAVLDGDRSLRGRPMERVVDPLRAAGAKVRELGEPGRLPLEITGGPLSPLQHTSKVASAQIKSALLLAGLGAGVPVSVVEPGPSRDHTERMLSTMGANVTTGSEGSLYRVHMDPVSESTALRPLSLKVPGDFSAAAFWIGLAVLGGAREGVEIESVGLNPRRTGFLRAMEAMGASVQTTVGGESAGEPVGTVQARPGTLYGLELPPEWLPTLLDEIPILACVASRANGSFVVRGAEELRVKESDRIEALVKNLRRVEAKAEELCDGLVVEGTAAPLKGRVITHGDHRIAMAFAVLGALPGNEIEIDDTTCVGVSYPGFWDVLHKLTRGSG